MNSISDTIYNFLVDPDQWGVYPAVAQIMIIGVMIIIWIIVGLLVIRAIKIVIFRSMKVNKNEARALTVANLLTSITKYLVWFIVTLLILGELNVDVTPFIASAGVLGLAVGFGAQEIVRDFISGFFIIFEGSFNVGDVVEVDGFKGNVLSLGLRTTIIENWLGERKIINNGSIGSIINFSKNDSIAIIDFGVGYDTDLEKLSVMMKDFVKRTEEKYEAIVETPQFLGVTELADSSINMRIIAKTNTMQHFQVERDIRKDLVELFGKHEVDIPFPQIVVHNA